MNQTPNVIVLPTSPSSAITAIKNHVPIPQKEHNKAMPEYKDFNLEELRLRDLTRLKIAQAIMIKHRTRHPSNEMLP